MADVFSFEHYFMVEMGLVVMGAVFLIWRRPTTRLRLKLKSASSNSNRIVPFANPKRSGITVTHQRPDVLNIHFQYNGHSFDAYEVLGLPAGSSWEKVEEAYGKVADASDPSSRDFLQAALMAIEKHIRGSAAS